MTNEEKISKWRGGDPSEVLRFTDPYDYEGCVIGVSTDGRVVYDYAKVMDYVCEVEKDNYDVADFEDEDDMNYNIMTNASDMINHDLRFYNPADKIPVFCRTDSYVDLADENSEFLIEGPYDFSSCSLGPDFRENRYIFSLSQMVDCLVTEHDFTKEKAIEYVYSLKKAGTVEDGFTNYVIVDDLLEENPLELFQKMNENYSLELEENCTEISGKDFSWVAGTFSNMFYDEVSKLDYQCYCQITNSQDDPSQIVINGTNGKQLLSSSLKVTNKKSLSSDIFMRYLFLKFLKDIVKDEDKVKLFEGNDCVFVKINDEIYSDKAKKILFPNCSILFTQEFPLKADFDLEFLKSFLKEMEVSDKSENNSITMEFADNKLIVENKALTKSTFCEYNFEENSKISFGFEMIENLVSIFEGKITLESRGLQSNTKVKKNGNIFLFMPIKQ